MPVKFQKDGLLTELQDKMPGEVADFCYFGIITISKPVQN